MRCSAGALTRSSSGRRSCVTRIPRGNCRSFVMVEASVIRKQDRYGRFGAKYVPGTLMPALHELEAAYEEAKADPSFREELDLYYRHYGGRPTPLYFARRLTEHVGGARIYLKREDLCHGGAHKFNNVMGQALLAKRMKKGRVIGEEIREQSRAQIGRLPDVLVACVGGGSNAMGTFAPFLGEETELLGAEAGGLGLASGKHAASLTGGRVGILHGARSYLLQDEDGQVLETHSISAGLDYPGVGPQLAELKDTKRASFVAVTDDQALEGFRALARLEGILPALESAHAVFAAMQKARDMDRDAVIIVTLSGRGDKDMATVADALGVTL